ncbi:hypothetical protein P7C73_g1496, partial [Tremellales sp. Uapishka_1]
MDNSLPPIPSPASAHFYHPYPPSHLDHASTPGCYPILSPSRRTSLQGSSSSRPSLLIPRHTDSVLPSIQIPSYYTSPLAASPYDPTLNASSIQNTGYYLRDPRLPSSTSHSPYGFLHPSQHLSTLSPAERTLRSPHPPLTASLHTPHFWPTSLNSDPRNRPYHSSPLGDLVSIPAPNPAYPFHLATYTSPPSVPPLHTSSPVLIPPPLRFKYSASPPNMPPRKKPAGSNTTTTSTPMTVSSGTGSRPRKVAAKGNGWTTEHTYDSIGQRKEIIIIEDSATPDKAPKKRTRAQAAAEAAIANGSSVNGSSSLIGSAKKRKMDDLSETASSKKGKGKASGVCLPDESIG